MRIGILGTFVWDTIRHPSSERGAVEQWGGLAYSLAGFAGSVHPTATLVPIARIGADLAPSAMAFLADLPAHISDVGLDVVPDPNNRVELRYVNTEERHELLTGGVPPWPWRRLARALESVDVLYVNFLSGFELTLDTSEKLSGTGLPIYADLHSLFLGPPGPGARRPRALPHRERWLRCFDAVQMNESETELLAEGVTDAMTMLRRIPEMGPGLALVTLGDRGAAYASTLADPFPPRWPRERRGPGQLGASGTASEGPVMEMQRVPLPALPVAGDPTGCGDVWGSVMFSSLCAGWDVETSIGRAHAAAAAKVAEPRVGALAARVRAALK